MRGQDALPDIRSRRLLAANRTYRHHGLAPLRSFATTITNAQPDLIIPRDDLATRQLHRPYDLERKSGKTGSSICRVIERSLGPAESFSLTYTRAAFLELAQQEGIRVFHGKNRSSFVTASPIGESRVRGTHGQAGANPPCQCKLRRRYPSPKRPTAWGLAWEAAKARNEQSSLNEKNAGTANYEVRRDVRGQCVPY